MKRIRAGSAALLAAALAGCMGVPKYTPGPPLASSPRHPYAVGVIQFDDATTQPATTGPVGKRQVNLALTGDSKVPIPAFPAELQASFFADELRASGLFPSVRLAAVKSELQGEELAIEGRVTEALQDIHAGGWTYSFAVELTAASVKGGAERWKRAARIEQTWMSETPGPGTLTIGERSEPVDVKVRLGLFTGGSVRLLQKMFRALIEDLDKSLSP